MASTSGRNGASAASTVPGSPCSTVCGGAVRSTPSSTASGDEGASPETGVTVGFEISVVVRLSFAARNSSTSPATLTAVPTTTLGALLVKTNRPSLVAGSSSGVVLWIQKPLLLFAVTTPCTASTDFPARGDRCERPWICGMVARTTGFGGGVAHGAEPSAAVVGLGGPAEKSAASSVSVKGPEREADVVFDAL